MNSPIQTTESYLKVSDVAARLSVSVSTVWGWTKAGLLPKPYSLGPNTSRWKLSEILEHEQSMVRSCLVECIDVPAGFFAKFDKAA